MAAADAYRLGQGSTGPVQQGPVTCGSASLTVARMLVNPAFARWVVSGVGADVGPPDTRTEAERFAEYERVVMKRTNGLIAAGGKLNLPWPHAVGTPPWGAEKELEHGAARRGASYGLRIVRHLSRNALRAAHTELAALVEDGLPALLYLGNGVLPRHVTLVLPGDGDAVLDVYDPATGAVSGLPQEAFASRQLRIAGWDVPWFLVRPHA